MLSLSFSRILFHYFNVNFNFIVVCTMYMYLLLYNLIPSDKMSETMYEKNTKYDEFSVTTLFNLGFKPRLKRVFTEY